MTDAVLYRDMPFQKIPVKMRDNGDGTYSEVLTALGSNPDVVTGNITAATAVPSTIAGLTAASYIEIAAGAIDSVSARISSITGGAATATLAFYGTDDGVNLYPIPGLPVTGTVGAGSFALTAAAAGLWQLKGANARKVYVIATAIGLGATVAAKLAATPNISRLTAILRGSLGGSLSAAAGTAPTEALSVQGTQPVPFTATIANGASLSGAVDLGTVRPARLIMPAAWTAAAISFDTSSDGVTFGPLYDQYGTEVSIASGVALINRQIILDPTLFMSVRHLKVRSGLSGATVNQGGSRDIIVVGA